MCGWLRSRKRFISSVMISQLPSFTATAMELFQTARSTMPLAPSD